MQDDSDIPAVNTDEIEVTPKMVEAMIEGWMDWRDGEWPLTVPEARELMASLLKAVLANEEIVLALSKCRPA